MSGVRRPRAQTPVGRMAQGSLVIAEGLAMRPDFLIVPAVSFKSLGADAELPTYNVTLPAGRMIKINETSDSGLRYTLASPVTVPHSWVLVGYCLGVSGRYVVRVTNSAVTFWTGMTQNGVVGEQVSGLSFVGISGMEFNAGMPRAYGGTHRNRNARVKAVDGMLAIGGSDSVWSDPGDLDRLYFGGNTGASFSHFIGMYALWRRPLPDALLAQYTRDPWQLVTSAANRKTWFIPPAAGGGPAHTPWEAYY